ncbi:hypothetical protein L6R52_34575 [Myxococcota bacterium]|nr:hypothetical protein [Myxococcota bacterium]
MARRSIASKGARLVVAVLAGATEACMAEATGSRAPDDAGIVASGPFCGVALTILPRCVACHRPGGQSPDLTLEGAQTSLVGVASRLQPARTLVVAGASSESFFYQKLTGPLLPAEGRLMPPGNPVTVDDLVVVRDWIDSGADTRCDVAPGGDGGVIDVGTYHPAGYAAPGVHGLELKFFAQDCRMCHGNTEGDELRGGAGPSCDSCHATVDPEWRSNCTFCHGSDDDGTGAPPRDLTGETDPTRLSFRAHRSHVRGDELAGAPRDHAPYDCTTCHAKPTSLSTPGHVFGPRWDGLAEVDFGRGIAAGASYDGAGQCSNVYCHGDGRTGGRADHAAPRPACGTCHAVRASGEDGWRGMSGRHRDHLREDPPIDCVDCHASTVGPSDVITGPRSHADGRIDVAFPATNAITRMGDACTGSCHGELHSFARNRWE